MKLKLFAMTIFTAILSPLVLAENPSAPPSGMMTPPGAMVPQQPAQQPVQQSAQDQNQQDQQGQSAKQEQKVVVDQGGSLKMVPKQTSPMGVVPRGPGGQPMPGMMPPPGANAPSAPGMMQQGPSPQGQYQPNAPMQGQETQPDGVQQSDPNQAPKY